MLERVSRIWRLTTTEDELGLNQSGKRVIEVALCKRRHRRQKVVPKYASDDRSDLCDILDRFEPHRPKLDHVRRRGTCQRDLFQVIASDQMTLDNAVPTFVPTETVGSFV